jgi:hypothetical protein
MMINDPDLGSYWWWALLYSRWEYTLEYHFDMAAWFKEQVFDLKRVEVSI